MEILPLLRPISSPAVFPPASRLSNQQRLCQTERGGQAVSSMPLDEFNLLFAGKGREAKKSDLSVEEIAELKRKERRAPLIRSALPAILKLWSPLPQKNNTNIKHGNIVRFLSDLESSPTASRSSALLQGVQALIDHPQSNELHRAETEYFNSLSDIREILAEGSVGTSVLLNALSPGPLRDSCIAYVLQQNHLGDIRQAAAKELHTVQNPAMRASLEAMVRYSPDFADIRQSLDKGNWPSFLLGHLISCAYRDEVGPALRKLYFDRPVLPDEHKRQVILSIVNDRYLGIDYYSVVPIVAAVGTFHDPKKRAEFIEELQKYQSSYVQAGLHLATRIQAPEKIAQLDATTALPTLATEALKPFLDRGFSLLDAPKLVDLLEKTGRDASALTMTILPAYDEVMDFALKHPEKLVKTGSKPPSEDEIRARFQKQGVLIMQALILTGESTLKNTIHRKRLDNLLEMMPTVTGCSDLLKPAYQLSKMTAESVDIYKLVEFMAGFSELRKQKELKVLLDGMVQNKKLDIKVLGKAYLATAFGNSVLKDVQIADDQFDKWDKKYLSTLVSALRGWNGYKREELIALCKAALQGHMQSFLHDPATQVGKNNLATQKAFETTFEKQGLKLNYQQWLHYPGEVVFTHLAKEDEKQAIIQAANDLFSDVQTQYSTLWPDIKAELSRSRLPMAHGQLQALSERSGYEEDLQELLQNESLFRQSSLKERANHLEKRIGNLSYAPPQTQQMKIKLWERQPGTDLFLGNYAGACIALDSYGGRSYTSLQANQNTFIQVAYLYDEANKPVGFGLFYWGKNTKTGEPVLILNTFEGRARGRGYEYNMQVRDKYVEFAKQYSRAVLGYAAPLYTGTELNPLYRDDLKETPINMHAVGSALHNGFYLDSLPDDGDKIDAQHEPNYRLELLDGGEPRPQVLSPAASSPMLPEANQKYAENINNHVLPAAFKLSPFVIDNNPSD